MALNIYFIILICYFLYYPSYSYLFAGLNTLPKHRKQRPPAPFARVLRHANQVYQPIRGTQWYLPREQKIQRWLQNKWEDASKKFGFQEYSMPVLARKKTFVAGGTPLGDQHYKELYTFVDKKGRNLSLRGDVTPQFMNMLKIFTDKNPAVASSIPKLYTIADCWRYERPSYCRRRNHLQWNADIVGISGNEVELELISLLIHFFKSVGLTAKDVRIALSHRKLIHNILKLISSKAQSLKWYYEFAKVLDKYKKLEIREFDRLLKELDMNDTELKDLHSIIDYNQTAPILEKLVPGEDSKELSNVVRGLEDMGYGDWIEIDLSIIRGNEYYSGIVFECFDRERGIPRSLAGGGRYDDYFLDDAPKLKYSAGFGMGNYAILNLLRAKKLIPKLSTVMDVLVFTPNKVEPSEDDSAPEPTKDQCSIEQRKCLYNLIDKLRENDVSVFNYYKTSKLKRALKFADKAKAKFAIMPMVHEGKQVIVIKDLNTKTQEYFDITNENLVQSIVDKIKMQL